MSSLKDSKIETVYKTRTLMFEYLIKAYIYKRKHYSNIIQSANYKRIHMENLIEYTKKDSRIIKYLNTAFKAKSLSYREYILASNMFDKNFILFSLYARR